MASNLWLGRAKAVAGVKSLTVAGTISAGDTFTVTINGKSITFTATTTTIAHVVAGLVALLNASTIPEFAEITWTDASPIVTATHDTAGVDFTITTSETAAAGTFVTSTATAATGPNFYDNANNWSLAAVPVSTDDVFIDTPVSILYGLDQSSVLLTSLTISARFSNGAEIGLPAINASGNYPEYRERYLKTGATTVIVGVGPGDGSNRINLNLGTDQTAVEVRKTGVSPESGGTACTIKAVHSSSTLDCWDGTSVGVAVEGGDSSTLSKISAASGANVFVGKGATVATLTGTGNIVSNGSITTITQGDGSWQINGTTAITTLTQNGGRLAYRSSGTVTAATIGGVLDCSGDMSTRTFTALTLKRGGTIIDPNRTITYTGGILLDSQARQVQAA